MMNNKWGAVCIDDVQARFRGERPETCRGNAVRRWTLSRQHTYTSLYIHVDHPTCNVEIMRE